MGGLNGLDVGVGVGGREVWTAGHGEMDMQGLAIVYKVSITV